MIAVCTASLATSACGIAGGELRSGINRYEVGNFNAAARHCGTLDDVHDELSDKAHTRYLVYCGLTHYQLGKRDSARELLVEGANEYERGPENWLKPRIVNELYKALDDLHGAPTRRPFARTERVRERRPTPPDEGSASGPR